MRRRGETWRNANRPLDGKPRRDLPFSARATIARLAVPPQTSGKVDDYKRFRGTVFAFCDADGRRDLFEFALQTSVIRELDVWFRLAPFPQTKFSAFSDVREAFQTAATELAVRGAGGDEVGGEVGGKRDRRGELTAVFASASGKFSAFSAIFGVWGRISLEICASTGKITEETRRPNGDVALFGRCL